LDVLTVGFGAMFLFDVFIVPLDLMGPGRREGRHGIRALCDLAPGRIVQSSRDASSGYR